VRPDPGGHPFFHVPALVCGVLVAGCGTDAESAPEHGVRRDEKVIRQYFPEPGDFEEVVWTGELLGDSRSSVPGPSDFRVSGMIRLTESDTRRLRSEYVWQAAPGRPTGSRPTPRSLNGEVKLVGREGTGPANDTVGIAALLSPQSRWVEFLYGES
jgi:hypothetical protein